MRMRMRVKRSSSGSWERSSFADMGFVDVCGADDGGQNEGRFRGGVAVDIAQITGGFLAGGCVDGAVVPGAHREGSWCAFAHRPSK